MNFDLSDDQKLLVDTAKNFANKSSPVERMRKLRESEFGFEREVYAEMGELGWLGVMYPDAVGGIDMSFVEMALILTELGKTLVPEPILESAILGGLPILWAGSSEQQKRWLPKLCEGKSIWALAWSEAAARFDANAITATATTDGNSIRLQGTKSWVLGGHAADHFVVSAIKGNSLGLFVVDKDASGLEVTRLGTIDSRGAAQLKLNDVEIDADRELAAANPSQVLDRVLDAGRAAACAEGVGVAHAAHEMTVEYLKTREQFGTLIGSFQVLQHRAVDMFVEIELCRGLAMEAMLRVANDDDERRASVSAAMAQLCAGGRHVVRDAIQLHGGIGITDEHDVGLYFKRMQALTAALGDEAFHLDRFSSLPSFAPV